MWVFLRYADQETEWRGRLGVCSDEMVADMVAAAVVAAAAVVVIDRLERLRRLARKTTVCK